MVRSKKSGNCPDCETVCCRTMGEEVANSFATQPLECCCGDGARGETDHLEACQRAFSAHAITDRAVQCCMKPVFFVSRLQPARKSVACVTPPSWWRKLCVENPALAVDACRDALSSANARAGLSGSDPSGTSSWIEAA